MPTTPKALPLNQRQRCAAFYLKAAAAFCLCLFSLSFAYAIDPFYELLDYPDYYAAFTPQMKDRIRKDAEEVSKSFNLKPRQAMTFCSNYWIKKCKALEKQGEICQNDRIKTEAEFQAWLNGTADAYKGISCLLSLRSEQKFVPKNTENVSETSYELIDPEYFASFTPQLMDRIQKDAEEVSKAYQMTPQQQTRHDRVLQLLDP